MYHAIRLILVAFYASLSTAIETHTGMHVCKFLLVTTAGLISIHCQSGEPEVECYTDNACSDGTFPLLMSVRDCCITSRKTSWYKNNSGEIQCTHCRGECCIKN